MRLRHPCAGQLPCRIVYIVLIAIISDRTAGAQDEEQRSEPARGPVFESRFSLDETRLAVAREKCVYVWDIESGKELQRLRYFPEPVNAVAFSPDGSQILTGGGRVNDMGSFSTDDSARLWELDTGQEVKRFVGHTSHVNTVAFSRDGGRILTEGRDWTARLWDVETERQLFTFPDVCCSHSAVQFSADGRSMVGLVGGGAG